jgi:hypothetical protein
MAKGISICFVNISLQRLLSTKRTLRTHLPNQPNQETALTSDFCLLYSVSCLLYSQYPRSPVWFRFIRVRCYASCPICEGNRCSQMWFSCQKCGFFSMTCHDERLSCWQWVAGSISATLLNYNENLQNTLGAPNFAYFLHDGFVRSPTSALQSSPVNMAP